MRCTRIIMMTSLNIDPTGFVVIEKKYDEYILNTPVTYYDALDKFVMAIKT